MENSDKELIIDTVNGIKKIINENKKLLRIKKKKEDLEKVIGNENIINNDDMKRLFKEQKRLDRQIREDKRLKEEKQLKEELELNNNNNDIKIENNREREIRDDDKRLKKEKKTSDYTLNIIKKYHKKPYLNKNTGEIVKNIYHSKKVDKYYNYLNELKKDGILIDNKVDISNRDVLFNLLKLSICL